MVCDNKLLYVVNECKNVKMEVGGDTFPSPGTCWKNISAPYKYVKQLLFSSDGPHCRNLNLKLIMLYVGVDYCNVEYCQSRNINNTSN